MAYVVRSSWSQADLLKAAVSRGKPRTRVTGGWLADLVALNKAILLCSQCERKFDARRNGYEQRRVVPSHRHVLSTCDGCRDDYTQCTLFLRRSIR